MNACFQYFNILINRSLSYIFVFGHTSLDNARLCEYLDLEDCSQYCKRVNIRTVENVGGVILVLLELQSVSYCLIRVVANVRYTHNFFLKSYNNNIHSLQHLDFTTSNTSGLAQKIIRNIYDCLKTWNDSYMTESQFTFQAVVPVILLLFNTYHQYEISLLIIFK